MNLKVSCRLDFRSDANIPLLLLLRPQSGYAQNVIEESFTLTPQVALTEYLDVYGNFCQRLVSPVGDFSIISEALGVCRDFSHLCIALCRSLSIPARMVVGYLKGLEPMDLHAWFEVYLANQWYTFDATQDAPRGNRVVLAYGKDASDVAFATQFGNIELINMRVNIKQDTIE